MKKRSRIALSVEANARRRKLRRKRLRAETLFSHGLRAGKYRKRRSFLDRAGFTKHDFKVTTLILAVIVAVSSDASTKIDCDHALRGLRKLNRIAR